MEDESISEFFLPNLSVKIEKRNVPAISDTKTTVENRVRVVAYSQRKSTFRSSASELKDDCSIYCVL